MGAAYNALDEKTVFVGEDYSVRISIGLDILFKPKTETREM